jgi:hypothetical protein
MSMTISASQTVFRIDDLVGGRRYVKEAQYVDALLAVLGFERQDVGLED